MRFTGIILAMLVATKGFAGLGIEVGGSYEMSTITKLIPDFGFNDPADVKLSGLKFHLGIPFAFVDSPSMSIYLKPTVGYLSTKSGTFEVPDEGDSSFKLEQTYSALPIGGVLGVQLKSGGTVFGAGLFYEMEMNGKYTPKVDAEASDTLKAKGSNLGIKLDAGMMVSPTIGLHGFFSYGSKGLEITNIDNTTEKFKASGMGFGAALNISLSGGKAAKAGKKKKSKKDEKDEISGDASSDLPSDGGAEPAKPKKSKKKSKKK